MNTPQTLKGFRDFLPTEARKRDFVIQKLKSVFESCGFEPLETPALEYEEVLAGKYGEEGNKLMYRFTDNGDRRVALRYDQTVPLARVIAQYRNELPRIFKRYQIQPVWRGENTQKGRYREFLQCDIDTVGTTDTLADAGIIECALLCLKELGLPRVEIWINDRQIFGELKISKSDIITIDKLDKIGREEVINQLENKNLLDELEKAPLTARLTTILDILKQKGFGEDVIKFTPTLARGLDYYTSTIFEIKTDKYPGLSIGGGGRYDNLIGMFSKESIPAVGMAFGFDRLVETLEDLGLLQNLKNPVTTLVTISSPELVNEAIAKATELKTELYPNRNDSLDKQIKYAKAKNIDQVAIFKDGEWTIKSVNN